jgi:hypothetical protein
MVWRSNHVQGSGCSGLKASRSSRHVLFSGSGAVPAPDVPFLLPLLSSLPCFLLATLKLQSTNKDRASQALAEGLPEGVSRSFRALAGHSDVARTTLQHRARGRRSKEQKAKDQQYLHPWEEKALAKFLIQQDALGRLVRIKHVRSIASVSLASGPQQTDHASLHI